MKKNCVTAFVAMFVIATFEAILLVSTMDYKIALEQENDRLRKQLAPKETQREAYEILLCPSGTSIAQRMDKRRADGTIYRSYWRRVCV